MASVGVPDAGIGTRKHQIMLAFVLFAVAYSAQTTSPVVLFYTVDLKLSGTELTAFFATYAIGLLPALLLGGPYSDKYGRRAVVVPSVILVVAALGTLLLAAHYGEAMIFVARFLQGFTSGAVYSVGTVWMRELFGVQHAARAAMIASAVMAVGFGVGPAVSGVLVQWAPWPKVLSFIIATVLVLVAVVLVRRLPETMTERRAGRMQLGVPRGTGAGFFWYLLPCGLLVYTFAVLALTVFPLQIAKAGFAQVYLLTGVSAFLVQGFAAFASGWAKRIGPGSAGWIGALAAAIGCGVGYFAVQPGGWLWILPSSAALGVAGGLSLTSGLMVSDVLTPPERRGALISMFYIVVYAGFTVPTLISIVGGKQTLEQGSTILALGIAALVIMVILAIPGRSLVNRHHAVAGSTSSEPG